MLNSLAELTVRLPFSWTSCPRADGDSWCCHVMRPRRSRASRGPLTVSMLRAPSTTLPLSDTAQEGIRKSSLRDPATISTTPPDLYAPWIWAIRRNSYNVNDVRNEVDSLEIPSGALDLEDLWRTATVVPCCAYRLNGPELSPDCPFVCHSRTSLCAGPLTTRPSDASSPSLHHRKRAEIQFVDDLGPYRLG